MAGFIAKLNKPVKFCFDALSAEIAQTFFVLKNEVVPPVAAVCETTKICCLNVLFKTPLQNFTENIRKKPNNTLLYINILVYSSKRHFAQKYLCFYAKAGLLTATNSLNLSFFRHLQRFMLMKH